MLSATAGCEWKSETAFHRVYVQNRVATTQGYEQFGGTACHGFEQHGATATPEDEQYIAPTARNRKARIM
jgi:hypothetical protein